MRPEPDDDPAPAGSGEHGAHGGLVIVGAGRIGCSLAIDLARSRRFDPITVVCRAALEPARSARLTALDIALVRSEPSSGLPERDPGAVAVALCVPDDRLEETAARWAEGTRSGRVTPAEWAFHTSGLRDAEAIAPLRRGGTAVAALHPLVAISTPGSGRFRGVTFGIDGDPRAIEPAAALAAILGGRPRLVKPASRTLYHLAAVFGSNFPVACLSVAAELLAASLERGEEGAPEAGAADPGTAVLGSLLPLARSALDNLERDGLSAGVTGPIARGDVETVRRHLAALDPVRRDLYRALGTELLAARGTRIDAGTAARLREALAPGGGDADSEGEASDGG